MNNSVEDYLNNGGEIVVSEDDIGCLLSHVSTGNTLKECSMGRLLGKTQKGSEELTMANPTSAFLSAGASLVPSPVTATTSLKHKMARNSS